MNINYKMWNCGSVDNVWNITHTREFFLTASEVESELLKRTVDQILAYALSVHYYKTVILVSVSK